MNNRKWIRSLVAALLCLALMCPAFALAEEAPVIVEPEIAETETVETEAVPAVEAEDGIDLELDAGADADVADIPDLDVDLSLALDGGLVEVEAEPEQKVAVTESNHEVYPGATPLTVSYTGPTLTKVYDCSASIFKKNDAGTTVYAITAPNAADFQLSGITAEHPDVQINIANIMRNTDGSSRDFPAADAGSYTLTLTFGLSGADAGYYYCEPVLIPAAITAREVVITPRAGLSKVYGAKDPVYKDPTWLSSDETSPLHQNIGGQPGYAVPLNSVDGSTKMTITNASYVLQCAKDHGTKFFPNDGFLSREPGEDVGRYRITLGNLDFGPNFTVVLLEEYFTITRRSLTDSAITDYDINDQTYTGKAIKPKIYIEYKDTDLVQGRDFKVTFSKNKNIGTATATVKGLGNYTGTLKMTFQIVPKPTTISKVKAGSTGQATVTWKKGSGITGYEVSYSQSSSFDSEVKKTVKATKTSLTLSGLTSRKTYYVRIRTYKKVSGKYYYSSWSKAKTVKVK